MQICSQCSTQNSNTALFCHQCQADLREFSTTAMALKRLQANPRVRRIKISICSDACPQCYRISGTYPKESAPRLPAEGCSHPLGCRCFYEPVLEEVFP